MKKEKLLEKVLNKLKEEKLFYKKIDMEKLQDIIFNILEETTENVDDSVLYYIVEELKKLGIKIEENAKDAGVSPKEFVDGIAAQIQSIWDLMNTSYDKFVRTTDPHHEEIVQHIFKKMYDNGDIYKDEYKGLYCTPCESFFTESQLVDGKCPDCGREVKKASEEAYFFRLDKYAKKLEEYIDSARKEENQINYI